MLRVIAKGIFASLFAIPLICYGVALQQRPELRRYSSPQPLFQGIAYQRSHRLFPRPQLIHRVWIDLTAPGLTAWSTPSIHSLAPHLAPPASEPPEGRRETLAKTATQALADHRLQLVINANFFFPFVEDAPWRTAPASSEPASLMGTAIAQSMVVSSAEAGWPAICFFASPTAIDQRAVISENGTCPAKTETAVAGNLLLMNSGKPGEIKGENLTKSYPMVIAALDPSGQALQLILIDGKQPFYSEGITLPEIIQLLQDWQIHTAIRLDGGGSTSLAIADTNGNPQRLNAVIQAKVPGRERPVANHLGFYAQPLQP